MTTLGEPSQESFEEDLDRIEHHLDEARRERGEAKRAFDAMMTMKKIDIAAIKAARRG